MSLLTPTEHQAILAAWRSRAEAQDYKPGRVSYAKNEVEFFVGVMSALQALGRTHPPIWDLLILSGRSISATLADKPAPPEEK